MSDHDWYRRKLPVAAAGLVTDEQQERLREHRESCEECRQRWHSYQEEAPGEPHLSSSMVARWPRAAAKLTGLEREMVQRHLERCEECREDLRLAGHDPALGAPAAPIVSRPASWWRGMTTGAVITAVAASIAWMLFMPRTMPPDGGVVPWVVPSQLRGGAVPLAPDTRDLALTLATPAEFDLSREAAVEVFDPDGQPLLRARILPEQLARSTIIVMIRSRHALRAGSYRVLLMQTAEDGTRVEVSNGFELTIEKQ